MQVLRDVILAVNCNKIEINKNDHKFMFAYKVFDEMPEPVRT